MYRSERMQERSCCSVTPWFWQETNIAYKAVIFVLNTGCPLESLAVAALFCLQTSDSTWWQSSSHLLLLHSCVLQGLPLVLCVAQWELWEDRSTPEQVHLFHSCSLGQRQAVLELLRPYRRDQVRVAKTFPPHCSLLCSCGLYILI